MDGIKLISWNVNGLRAAWNKGFLETFRRMDADLFAIQETKLQPLQLTEEMLHVDGYNAYWSFSMVKKGYSGVGVYSRIPPLRVETGIGIPRYDGEGRVIALDFGDFLFFNVYFPNGQMSDERLRYKLDFYRDFFAYLAPMKKVGKHLVIAGDYNTAHNEIDLKNPKANENTSGFLRVERDRIDAVIREGYVDTFRYFYPETVKYSWWSYRFKARERNAGWRIDYIFTTQNMIAADRIRDPIIDNTVFGSDHCPIGLTLLR